MARRIRRRPTVIWLPLTSENRLSLSSPITGVDCAFGQYVATVSGSGDPGAQRTGVFPVVNDQPQNIAGLTSSLADTEGSAYHLRRIVGKIFVEFDQQIATPHAQTVAVTVGFMVIEVEPSLNFLPKSATFDDYNCANLDNIRDPWIWRRTWVVGANEVGGSQFSVPPQNNFSFGSGGVMDGPHIDAKTARSVKDEQRLAMVITTTQISPSAAGADVGVIVVTTDLRVLGSLRKQSGNRRNASR